MKTLLTSTNTFKTILLTIFTISLFSCKDDEATPTTQTPTSELLPGTWEDKKEPSHSYSNERWTFNDSTFTEQSQECNMSSCYSYRIGKSGDYKLLNDHQLVICYEQVIKRGIRRRDTEKVNDTINISSISSDKLILKFNNEDKSFNKVSSDVIIPISDDY